MQRSPGDISTIVTKVPGRLDNYKNGILVSWSNTTESILADYRPVYGYGNRRKIGNLVWIDPTGYKHFSREVKAPGIAYRKWRSGNNIIENKWSNPPIFGAANSDYIYTDMSTLMKANSRDAAQVKALNAVGSNAANIGEDLATYMQTVRMFGNKVSLLHGALKAFKSKKQFKAYWHRSSRDIARSGDKKLAEAYLEYVYGWKPLVSDVYGVYQLLKEYSSGARPVIIHGHGSQHQTTSFQSKARVSSSTGEHMHTCTEKYSSRCDLYGRVNPDLVAFRMLNQLGLLNPLSFAWEITPWSFVVDWLIPIGPMLSAFTAPIGLDFISGTTATKMDRVWEGEFHCGLIGDTSLIDEPLSYTVTDAGYDRIVHSTWPFPAPYLNLNPLSGDRWLKALALAVVNLRR